MTITNSYQFTLSIKLYYRSEVKKRKKKKTKKEKPKKKITTAFRSQGRVSYLARKDAL